MLWFKFHILQKGQRSSGQCRPLLPLAFLFQYILACAATARTSSAPGGFLRPLTPVLPLPAPAQEQPSTNDWQDLVDK